MPELPEVETIRRDLAPELAGRTIHGVELRHDDLLLDGGEPAVFRRALEGRRIEAVDRRAKYLLFRLTGDRVLEVQLRMTGRFALGAEPPDPREFTHLGAAFRLDDGRTLYYDDVRRLGGFRLQDAEAWERRARDLGPEPLAEGFGPASLRRAFRDRRAPVKNVLLDQRRVAGVGNIYASESLHAARIDPRRPAGSLSEEECGRLADAVRSVLAEALRHAGTTFRNYRAVNGRSGAFQERLRVYARAGEACGRCGDRLRRLVQAGRSTFFCPGCQE